MRFDRHEGEVLPQEPWFLYGRNFDSIRTAVGSFDTETNMTVGSNIHRLFNGWYFVFRFKVLKWKIKYFDPATFDISKRKCFPVIMIMRRKPRFAEKFHLFRHITWIPVE